MTLFDYLAIALTLLLFKTTQRALLCYSGRITTLHNDRDLLASHLQEFFVQLDRRFGSRWLPPIYLTALSCVVWPFVQWDALDTTHTLRPFYVFLAAVVTWWAVSQGKDWYRDSNAWVEKGALVASCVAFYFYPGFLILLLFIAIHFLRSWSPAQVMVLRTLQLFVTFLVANAILKSALYFTPWGPIKFQIETSLFLSFLIIASHYVTLGFAKIQTGRRWYSWAKDNRSHYQAAAAYMWGWIGGRWGSDRHALDKLAQILVIGVECAWFFVLFNDEFTRMLCLVTMLYHLYIFIKSGLFYLPSILVNLALYVATTNLLPPDREGLFNPLNGVLCAILLIVLSIILRLWNLPRLALWDSPFIGRIVWKVEGMSGKIYGLYNSFMGPYARFFGSGQADFLIPRKIFHRFLGQVPTKELRDAIVATAGDPKKIEALQAKYGSDERDDASRSAHDTFLVQFFRHYNKGRRKQKFSWWFIQAPGTYWYYWENGEPFRGQERVAKVLVSYREGFFDEKQFLVVREEQVEEIVIPLKKFEL